MSGDLLVELTYYSTYEPRCSPAYLSMIESPATTPDSTDWTSSPQGWTSGSIGRTHEADLPCAACRYASARYAAALASYDLTEGELLSRQLGDPSWGWEFMHAHGSSRTDAPAARASIF